MRGARDLGSDLGRAVGRMGERDSFSGRSGSGDNIVCVTVLGRDRPGIIAGITRVLHERAANIRESAMTILGHQCAMLIIVQLPRNMSMTELERALEGVKKQYELSVFVTRVAAHELSAEDIGPARNWSITLYGGDHPGIVHEVAQRPAWFDG